QPFFDRAGEALRELDVYARLRERDRLATIGEMAAGLAHEIRNPLGAIKGAAQVIDPKPGDPAEPFLKIIIEEVNRLNDV
ncbi:histidine kinase dimerization/phospho-acceptor domain-containing protein, partial [Acinetobacter baumannii]